MTSLLKNNISKNHHIVLPDEKFIPEVESMFDCKIAILKQAPSYQEFLDTVTFEKIEDDTYNESLTGFRLYINRGKNIVGISSENLKFNILSISNHIIRIDGIVITPELKLQLQKECRDIKTALLWASMDRQLFERIAMQNDPADVQRLCMTNKKLRGWCDREFYARMLMHYFGEESDDPKSSFVDRLNAKAWIYDFDNVEPMMVPIQGEMIHTSTCAFHSLCIDKEGQVWSIRRLEEGFDIVLIPIRGKAVDVSCEQYVSSILDSEGQVWRFGHSTLRQRQINLSRVECESKIVKIASGSTHSIYLDSEGRMWSHGSNAFGQLGLGHFVSQREVQRIRCDAKIVQIGCGDTYSMCLDKNGSVWTSGMMTERGRNPNRNSFVKHEHLSSKSKIRMISCGSNCALLLDSKHQVRLVSEKTNTRYRERLDMPMVQMHHRPFDSVLLPFEGRVIGVVCGSMNRLIVIDSNYRAWQVNDRHDDFQQNLIPFDKKILSISCNTEYCIMIGK